MNKCPRCEKNEPAVLMNVLGMNIHLCSDCFIELSSDSQKMGDFLESQTSSVDAFSQQPEPLIDEKEDGILTELTKTNFPKVYHREEELRNILHILMRKTKSNPILIGEAGTGKTAIVEWLATQIKNGAYPRFKDFKVYSLNPGAIMAGTKYRGALEQKVEEIIQIVSNEKCILFIDEIHMLMGSSGDENGNIANLLKPHLARGKMKLIGSTTLDEFRRIEKDPAFSRRVLPVTVPELTVDQTIEVLQNILPEYSNFHSVEIGEEVIPHIVRLADRYVSHKFFPDKAIDILDDVMAATALENNDFLPVSEKNIMKISFKQHLVSNGLTDEKAISDVLFEIDAIEQARVIPINKNDVNRIVEKVTGIPLTSLEKEEKAKLRVFGTTLSSKVIGQKEATSILTRAVKRSRMKIANRNKPTVLFFAGPTGVGKTEAAKVLAETLFGKKDSLLRFDMSEFMQPHSTSKLIGAPPGYIGHDKPGELTEHVRRNPFSVILLDEYEKAHPDVSNLFLQVFDDGRLTDTNGRVVDFKNTIIIMTSNIGVSVQKSLGFGTQESVQEAQNEQTLKALRGSYRPEFLNRIDEIITFNSLTKEDLMLIVELEITHFQNSLSESELTINLSEGAKLLLVEKGFDKNLGARPLKRTIARELEDLIIDHLIDVDEPKTSLQIDVSDEHLIIK